MRSFPRPTLLAAGMVLFVLPVLAQTPPPPPAPPAPPTQTASPTPPAPGTFGGQNQAVPANLPWMNPALDPDRRADMVLAAMTQDEKIALVHGAGNATGASDGGAGFVPGIPRLGLPDLNMADSSVGLTRNGARGRYSTLLPSTLGEAASWDGQVDYAYGALIGREARAEGYNVSLAGGMDLARDPRDGRNFEYLGEDPVLAGESFAKWVRGLQDQTVIGDIKHYAFNDQETGRTIANVVLDERSMRESDLLAFEIGIKKGQPGMVMCAYNKVNGDWSCENDYLLNQVLKRDWDFRGFVLSDWGATHSTAKAALAGLDQEQPGGGVFWRGAETGGRQRPGAAGAAGRHGASHPAHRIRLRRGGQENGGTGAGRVRRSGRGPAHRRGLGCSAEKQWRAAAEHGQREKHRRDRQLCRCRRLDRRRLGAGGPARWQCHRQ